MATMVDYRSDRRATFGERLGELWDYRDLLYNLTVRDLKVRYKHSWLGILWSLLNPLLIMLVFTFAFTVMMPSNIPHYPVFLLAGLLPWTLFNTTIIGSANQIIQNGALISKVRFPREALPLSSVLSNSVNFMLSLIPLIFFLIASDINFTWNLLWLPLIFLIQFMLLTGLALLFSALAVFVRDIVMVLDVAMLGLFFLTPIFYPLEQIQGTVNLFGQKLTLARVMRWINPMASIIDAYRGVIYGTIDWFPPPDSPIYYAPSAPDGAFILRTGLTALLILVVGWFYFRKMSPRFGEEL